MGLFRKNKGGEGGGKAPFADAVQGTARVTAASSPQSRQGGSMYKNGTFHFVVEAPGVAAFAVEVNRIQRTRHWPRPGMVLPAWVSASNPQRYEIDFDAVPDWQDAARQQTEAQAALLRGEAPAGAAFMVPGANVQFVGGSPADLPPEKLAKLEQFLGVDLNGDGRVGAPATSAPPPPPPPPAGGDRVAQLERLAALHASGALTDDEFAREKQRLLG